MKLKSIILSLIFTTLFACSSDDPIIPSIDDENLVPVPAPAEMPVGKVWPLILVVGQSNAEGIGTKAEAPNWLQRNNYKSYDYFMWNKHQHAFKFYGIGSNTGSENNTSLNFTFDIFFARKYIDSYGGTLVAIKQSYGGCPISEKGSAFGARWTPHVDRIPKGDRSMVQELSVKIEEAKAYAQSKNAQLLPVAILFHQGESDSEDSERLADYNKNLTDLVASLRSMAGVKDLPVICGELKYAKNTPHVNKIFHEMSKKDPNFKTVIMANHQSPAHDMYHYGGVALEHMGSQMFEYYRQLKK